MATGWYSKDGFEVVASNALDLLAGTQAAGSGMVAANVQDVGDRLHVDLVAMTRDLSVRADAARGQVAALARADQAGLARVADVSRHGMEELQSTVRSEIGDLKALSAANLAVSALGFAVVAHQLSGVRGELGRMRTDLVTQGQQMLDLQARAVEQLESLSAFAQRTLHTQERVFETLVNSRTVEAQQLVRQGWANLEHGYEAEAYERFVESLKFDNTVYATHAYLGQLHEKRGERVRAQDHFTRATRFARTVSPEMEAFAHVQHAGFLARGGDVPAAIDEQRVALGLKDHPEWRLRLAEFYVQAGETDSALREVEAAIRADSDMLVASMGAPVLQTLGEPLTTLAVRLDEEARGELFRAVATLAERIDAVDRAVEGVPEADRLVTTARRQTADVFAVVVTGSYAEVTGSLRDVSTLSERVLGMLVDASGEAVAGLAAWRAGWEHAAPKDAEIRKPPKTVGYILWAVAAVAPFAYAALIGDLVVGVVFAPMVVFVAFLVIDPVLIPSEAKACFEAASRDARWRPAYLDVTEQVNVRVQALARAGYEAQLPKPTPEHPLLTPPPWYLARSIAALEAKAPPREPPPPVPFLAPPDPAVW